MKEARRTMDEYLVDEYLVEPEVQASLARRSLNMCLRALGRRPVTRRHAVTTRHDKASCRHLPTHAVTSTPKRG